MNQTAEPHVNPAHRQLSVDYALSDEEREALYRELRAIPINPYRHYTAFRARVASLAGRTELAPAFFRFMREVPGRDPRGQPFLFLRNCPIDKVLPVFDIVDPVKSKHALKNSFVAEGFLSLFAHLQQSSPIAYLNVNDGDVFQDIYPRESMKHTQSQKALGEIYFHKDLANHYVRPDFVNILALRSDPRNETMTVFVRNLDIMEQLDQGTAACLRRQAFHTPFDDLSVAGSRVTLGDAERHAVIQDNGDIRFFENRTIGLDDEARQAVQTLSALLHRVQQAVLMQGGDFIAIQNNCSLHGKQLGTVAEPELLPTRWMIKTVNVLRPADHAQHLLPGSDYLVNG